MGAGNMVGWRFKLVFLVKFGVSVAAASALSGAAFYMFINWRVGPTYGEGLRAIHQAETALAASLVYSGLLQIGVAGIAVAALALFVSHRIAGPIYRIEKVLDQMAGGDLRGPIRLRAGDEVQALAAALNEAAARLRDHLSRLRALQADVADLERGLCDSGVSGDDLSVRVRRLRGSMEEIRLEAQGRFQAS